MKAIIVDDEPKAIELIRKYLAHFQQVELAGTFRNGLKAYEFLDKEKIDLVFLDINMPHISGISLSRMIHPATSIIFTTAHAEYAVESYEVRAVDYLMKPISLERFMQAMSKILGAEGSRGQFPQPERRYLLIKSGAKTYRCRVGDVLFLEKQGNYMEYHLKDKKVVTRETISEALAYLPDCFLQVHRSFIVNTMNVSRIESEQLFLSSRAVPVGPSFREEMVEYFKAG